VPGAPLASRALQAVQHGSVFRSGLKCQPQAKALLARHGFTPHSYALTAMALFQAGFYLAMEPSMDKKKGAALLASYPKETQANIELLRKNPALLKK
jgi:hypothetical protein